MKQVIPNRLNSLELTTFVGIGTVSTTVVLLSFLLSAETPFYMPAEPELNTTTGEAKAGNEQNKPTPKRRKILVWILGVLLTPLVLLFLVGVLLYIPPIQSKVLAIASKKVSEATGYQVRLKQVGLGFPLKLKAKEVLALDEHADTVAYLAGANIHVSLLSLLYGTVNVTGGQVENLKLHYFSKDSLFSLIGNVGELKLKGVSYNTKTELVLVSDLKLRDTDIAVFYGDTTQQQKPKPQKKSNLQILLGNVALDNVLASYAQVPDSALVNVFLEKGRIQHGDVNIGSAYYKAEKLLVTGRLFRIGAEVKPLPLPWDVHANLHDAYYDSLNIRGDIRELSYFTADHWGVHSGQGQIVKDSVLLQLKNLQLLTQKSDISVEATVPMHRFMPDTVGNFNATVKGSLFLSEFARFMGKATAFPERPITVDIVSKGEMQGNIDLMGSVLAEDIAEVKVAGRASQVMDSLYRNARLDYHVSVYNLMSYLKDFGVKHAKWSIPNGTFLDGDLKYTAQRIETNTLLQSPKGTIKAEGFYAPKVKGYKGFVTIDNLSLQQFLPHDTITHLSGHITAEGQGVDPFSPTTRANVFAIIDSVRYRTNMYRDLSLVADLKKHQFFTALNSDNPGLAFTAQADGTLKRNDVRGSLNFIVDSLAPANLGLQIGIIKGLRMELRTVLESDLKEYYKLEGEIENSVVETDKKIIRPENTYLSALSCSDSLLAQVKSGDLNLRFSAQNGLQDFLNRVKQVSQEVQKIVADTLHTPNMQPCIAAYPTMELKMSMGRENVLRTYLDERRIGWRSLQLNLATSTKKGLEGNLYVNSFQKDTFRINEMDVYLNQDSSFLYTVASVHKERFRNQKPFDLMLSLTTNLQRTELFTNWKDDQDKDFLLLGMDVTRGGNNDFTIRFTPDPPILAYNKFTIADNSYITIPRHLSNPIKADMKLTSNDGSVIAFKDSTTGIGSALNLQIRNFGLEKVKNLSVIPDMDGKINAYASWIRSQNEEAYTAEVGIDSFYFRRKPVGNFYLKAMATPEQGGKMAAAQLLLDNQHVGALQAYLPNAKHKPTLWEVVLVKMPVEKVNPFLPQDYAEMQGTVDAQLFNFQGGDILTAQPSKIHGQVVLNKTSVYVPRLNERYGLESPPIEVKEDRVYLQNLALVINGNSKLIAEGTVDLTPDTPLNLHLYGNNMRLLDSKQTAKTMIHGVLEASANLHLQGPAKTVNITGDLSLSGNTHVVYTSQDGGVQKRDKFSGLVEFTDFGDTLFVVKKSSVDSLSLGGMNVRLNIHIDPAVRVTALLSKDESNSAYIQGGGDFNFYMPPYGKMSLSGRYDVEDGFINYSVPAVGKKKFVINRDSRVTWAGNVLNPDINFRASSRVKSDVSMSGETPKRVNFDVSIVARNSLDDLALIFDLDAPEDLSMRNFLAAMTEEERSRQALILLATGHFLGSQPTGGGFDANMAIASLLASELNALAGEALDAEINFGVEEGAPERGGGMSYSYSIAKKFYNDRISVVVGGKVETGANAMGLQQSFIDNMSLDYRLDKAGTHYLRLFHKKNYENLLDGEVIETGAGYVLRRRLSRLRDLFNFSGRRNKPLSFPVLPDSVNQYKQPASPPAIPDTIPQDTTKKAPQENTPPLP